MKTNVTALISGILFGLGLALSQMINPNKVLNFLDIAGNWDPSLIFVMLGALIVSSISFRFIFKRNRPIFAEQFHLAKSNIINKPLIIGATLFGIGWGMTGYCPGPAIASLGLFSAEGFIMSLSIYAGFISHQWIIKK